MIDQSKELRALYIKGYMVGNHCNIQLKSPIWRRNAEGEMVKLAEADEIIHATIKKSDTGLIVYEATFEFQTAEIPLTEGKVR